MLQELLQILNYENNNIEISDAIEQLMEMDLTPEQEELIYTLASASYELGRDEGI